MVEEPRLIEPPVKVFEPVIAPLSPGPISAPS
jgi:hypothetical protein